ncbi:neutral zinc metallopeptidase [Haloechinothrix sp. LS1_15]|uniref:neutral zinc metallopeptidase n=1 Tax=Haloechinothrix sp. LS1_15 TaxID=2652248 RepID=UPI002947EBA4|nr:neutral zinc metallopeptidase [Haloechinothrix sp. LS1_15]MDV6013833.1 metalloprotease [Haloechinothrix sp. LS1_15]
MPRSPRSRHGRHSRRTTTGNRWRDLLSRQPRYGLALGACLALLASGVVVGVLGGEDRPAAERAVPEDGPVEAHRAPGDSGSGAAGSPPDDAEPVEKLDDHPLLADPDIGLPNRKCELPGWQSTPEAAEEFFRAATECLNAAWEPVLRAHDLPFESPSLVFPDSSRFTSECGQVTVNVETAAYYCKGEIFLPFEGLQTQQYGDQAGVYLALLGHEYGHHVQELAGIMDAVWDEIYTVGVHSEAGQEMSRRKELQAQCFSGMFLGSHVELGSVSRDMYEQAWADQETRGDDTSGGRDHGSNENYATWWRDGAQHNSIAGCNTFTASSEAVS